MPRAKQVREKKPEPKCKICGDTGLVYRAYLEPECAQQYAKDLRQCPKCRKGYEQILVPIFFRE